MIPVVSIVIPTRNRVHFLPQAIHSCLMQTGVDIELIIVDDASIDGTTAFISALKEPRIVYVKQDRQCGSVAALNRGFRLARGQYLTWSSDDDYYSTAEAVAALAGVLEREPAVGFVYAHYDRVDEGGKFICEARVEDPPGLDRDNYVGHCFLYRRNVYETIGDYNPEFFLTEEYEYWLRIRQKFIMKRIPQRLYCHRMHPQSLTMTHREEQVQAMVARARKKFIPAWKQHFYLAETHYHTGYSLKAIGNAVLSLILNPINRAGWRILVLNVFPAAVITFVCGKK